MMLKKVQVSDKVALQQIGQAAYAAHFADHWDHNGLALYLEDQFGDERLRSDLNNPSIDYYFIQIKKETVGFLKLNTAVQFDNYPPTASCELEKIYLLPAWAGKGLGRSAMEATMENVKNLGKQVFFLCVIDTNHTAIAFYKRLGFSIHSRTRLDVPHFKEELKGMYRMVKELEK